MGERTGRKTTLRRRRTLAFAALLLWVWGALAFWTFRGSEETEAAKEEGPPLVRVEMTYTYDVFDERRLIGVSDNVFVGNVESRVGDKPLTGTIPGGKQPQTQYAVRVIRTVKSSGERPLKPGDDAVVNQAGGHDENTGKTYPILGFACGRAAPDAPLVPGEEYLLATVYDGAKGWHVISAQPAGDVPLAGPEDREALVAAYRHAAEEQVNPLSGEASPCG